MYINDGNKNNLRTTEAQIVPKLKNNEPQPIFTSSYKKVCNSIQRGNVHGKEEFVVAWKTKVFSLK